MPSDALERYLWDLREIHANGKTMPGKGKTTIREFTTEELTALEDHHLGGQAVDVFLNMDTFWHGVPLRVWEYTLCGYQVIKKWLSYREYGVLGRTLTVEEAREVTAMARRIAAILMLKPALDENVRDAQH